MTAATQHPRSRHTSSSRPTHEPTGLPPPASSRMWVGGIPPSSSRSTHDRPAVHGRPTGAAAASPAHTTVTCDVLLLLLLLSYMDLPASSSAAMSALGSRATRDGRRTRAVGGGSCTQHAASGSATHLIGTRRRLRPRHRLRLGPGSGSGSGSGSVSGAGSDSGLGSGSGAGSGSGSGSGSVSISVSGSGLARWREC